MSNAPDPAEVTPRLSSRFGRGESAGPLDLYAEITRQVMAMLERGVVPWRSPILGQVQAGKPKNLTSGQPYRGVNVFLLAFAAFAKGYESPYWLTFQQAKQRSGAVKKGEKSTMVIFYKPHVITDSATGERKKVPVLRHYSLFNAAAQCEGFEVPGLPQYTPTEFSPVAAAEAIVSGYTNGPKIHHTGSSAFYRPKLDEITVPEPSRFTSTEHYYSTLFHEMVHSTGHSKRLDRKIDTDPNAFGSPGYGKEELIAEMGSAFLCGDAGIHPAVIEDHAAYVSGWLGALKNDKRLVIAAAGAAQRAAEHIRGVRQSQVSATDTESALDTSIGEPA